MAKELPYFKFEPNRWENGNIQMCSYEEKGIFIDLCSMYWSRLGDVPFKLAVQKICGGNANALQSLCDNNIFEVINGYIYIKFLSEQLNEFDNISERNSKIAKEGWEKRRKQKNESERNASALQAQNERNAIRGEEIREEERNNNKFNFKKSLLSICKNEQLINDWLVVRKNKKASNTKTAFNLFIEQVKISDIPIEQILQICVEKSWSGYKFEWIKNTRNQQGTNLTNNNTTLKLGKHETG